MKLIGSESSPYVRKCRMVIIEKGLSSSIQEVMVVTADNPKELLDANPLGKIPALVLDDSEAMIDSPVICEYLDSIAPGPRLIPQDGNERFEILHLVAVADGVLDASVALTMESRRPEQYQFPAFIDRQKAAIMRTVGYLENGFAVSRAASEGIDMADIAIAAALGYLDFRHSALEWRKEAPKLAAWHQKFAAKACYIKTAPKG